MLGVYQVILVTAKRWPLMVELVWRELRLRYRGTWLGFFWTLLNPLIMTLVYTLVFSHFLRLNIPKFPAFLFCGLLPWIMWFTESVIMGTNSLVDHASFLKNAIFPSQILPITAVIIGMVNFVFSLPILIIFLWIFEVPLKITVIALPVVMIIQFFFILGIVYFTATYNVFFRDLRYIVQHTLSALFFLTPIMYDFSLVPSKFHFFLKLNLMSHIIDAYRKIFFYGLWPSWNNLGCVLLISIILLVIGTQIFEKHREIFAEYL